MDMRDFYEGHGAAAWAMYSKAELLQALRVMGVAGYHLAFAKDGVDAATIHKGITHLMAYPSTAIHDAAVALGFRLLPNYWGSKTT